MRAPSHQWLSVVAILPLLLLSTASRAEDALVSSEAVRHTHPSGEIFGARVRYGVVLRKGGQDDVGPGLSYDGLTPNDVQVQINYFPLDLLGLEANVQREGFALFNDASKVTAGSLLRADAGPKLRVKFGPLRLDVLGGYQFAQLPVFGSSVAPAFQTATRHSVLLAARAKLDLPAGFNLQARGEYPVSIAVSAPGGGAGKASGFAGGGGIGYTLGSSDKLFYGILVDYQYVQDRVEFADTSTVSTQTLQRIGAGLELDWMDAPAPPPPPRFGGLLISVVDADTGAPVPNPQISLGKPYEQPVPVPLSADGSALAKDLRPGLVAAVATAAGYLPAEAEGEVVAGRDTPVVVRAKKEPPKVGGLVVAVTDNESGAPIVGATVTVAGKPYTTGPDGTATVTGLPPGAVSIQVAAQGYKNGDEAATVIAGRDSQVPIQVVQAQKRVLASISGLVRSTRGGAPVAASLEIPQLKLKTTADDKGAFTMRVPGGTYNVIISAEGYLSQKKSLVVKDGDQAIFNVDLFPKK